MSVPNLGAGASASVGAGIVALPLPVVGLDGVRWTYAVLYLISAALALVLTLPSAEPERSEATPARSLDVAPNGSRRAARRRIRR
jgi:hypothetical protein